MPITPGTTQIKIRNVENIEIIATNPITQVSFPHFIDGANIEQGVTVTINSGSSTTVANGAKVSTSEKVLISWVQIGSTLAVMNASLKFASNNVPSIGVGEVLSLAIFTTEGKSLIILKPIISAQRMVKTNDLIRYSFSVERNGSNADDIINFS